MYDTIYHMMEWGLDHILMQHDHGLHVQCLFIYEDALSTCSGQPSQFAPTSVSWSRCRFEKREPSDGKHATDVKDVTTWKNRLRLGNSVKKKITQTKQATTKSYQRGHKKRPSIAQSWQSWAHRKHLRQHSKLPSGSWWCTGYRSRGHRLDGEPSTPRKLGHRPCSRQRRSPFRGTWQRSKSAPSSRRRTCTQMKRNKEMEREKNEYNSETCCEGE